MSGLPSRGLRLALDAAAPSPKLALRALLEYPPDGGHAVAVRGSRPHDTVREAQTIYLPDVAIGAFFIARM
jgi:hypothetical protein